MKETSILIPTPFGNVPYEAIKEYLPVSVTSIIDKNKDTLTKETVSMDIRYYINSIAKKHGYTDTDMQDMITKITSIYPFAAFAIILKEVAIELDKAYPDHISNCKEVYVISSGTGKITKIPSSYVKNFRNFAAFRTEEDARIACRILRHLMKQMFSK